MLREEFRSDKRIKGGKVDICKMCDQKKILRLSHIVPRWAYEWAKKESNQSQVIGMFPSLGIPRIIQQDGPKTYLLCDDCESLIGLTENYVKNFITGKNNEINHEYLHIFLISIAYKAHFTNAAPFHKINIESKYLNLMQTALLESTKEECFLIFAHRFLPDQGIDPKAMIIPQSKQITANIFLFSVILGGWEWFLGININEDFSEIDFLFRDNDDAILRRNRNWKPPIGKITEHRFLLN